MVQDAGAGGRRLWWVGLQIGDVLLELGTLDHLHGEKHARVVNAAELGATWESLVDADGTIAAQIPVNAAPLTLLLDTSGRVLDYQVGPFATLEEIEVFVAGK